MVFDSAVPFAGFGSDAVAWFEGLERDNSRAYFQRERPVFERAVRGPFETLLDDLSLEFGGQPKVFRQNRDTRFSPDKSPYKTRTYGILYDGSGTAWYASVSASGLYAATGWWQMADDQLERYRAAASDELAALLADVRAAGLELAPPALKTAPRGYPRDHPQAALLRYKSLIAGRALPPGPALESREALEFTAATWRAATPLNAWLAEHVGPTATTPRRRGGGGSRGGA
jgi:uncharacterized protein (TIGR02453 family)